MGDKWTQFKSIKFFDGYVKQEALPSHYHTYTTELPQTVFSSRRKPSFRKQENVFILIMWIKEEIVETSIVLMIIYLFVLGYISVA